jgi:hypothetical protein
MRLCWSCRRRGISADQDFVAICPWRWIIQHISRCSVLMRTKTQTFLTAHAEQSFRSKDFNNLTSCSSKLAFKRETNQGREPLHGRNCWLSVPNIRVSCFDHNRKSTPNNNVGAPVCSKYSISVYIVAFQQSTVLTFSKSFWSDKLLLERPCRPLHWHCLLFTEQNDGSKAARHSNFFVLLAGHHFLTW